MTFSSVSHFVRIWLFHLLSFARCFSLDRAREVSISACLCLCVALSVAYLELLFLPFSHCLYFSSVLTHAFSVCVFWSLRVSVFVCLHAFAKRLLPLQNPSAMIRVCLNSLTPVIFTSLSKGGSRCRQQLQMSHAASALAYQVVYLPRLHTGMRCINLAVTWCHSEWRPGWLPALRIKVCSRIICQTIVSLRCHVRLRRKLAAADHVEGSSKPLQWNSLSLFICLFLSSPL